MKSTRILLISIPAVILIAGLVGFLISFPSSPQVAIARVFIDLGVMIALLCATFTLPKPAVLRTAEVADALRDLVRGRYDKRLPDRELGELGDIARAFNELAGTLSDSRDLDATYLRYKAVSKEAPPARPVLREHYSHHPELGPVKPLPIQEEELSQPESEPTQDVEPAEFTKEQDDFEFDTRVLYQRFKDAHDGPDQVVVDFDHFHSTIDRARLDLLAAHKCKDVRFEIVTESGKVALQPRLVR